MVLEWNDAAASGRIIRWRLFVAASVEYVFQLPTYPPTYRSRFPLTLTCFEVQQRARRADGRWHTAEEDLGTKPRVSDIYLRWWR